MTPEEEINDLSTPDAAMAMPGSVRQARIDELLSIGNMAGQDSYSQSGSRFADLVDAELAKANAAHGPMRSTYEGYAVILEEVRELEAEVFKKKPDRANLLSELVQVATMCRRMAQDVCKADNSSTKRNTNPVRSYHEGYAMVLSEVRRLENAVFHPDRLDSLSQIGSRLAWLYCTCQQMAEQLGLMSPKVIEIKAVTEPRTMVPGTPWHDGFKAGLRGQCQTSNPFLDADGIRDWREGWGVGIKEALDLVTGRITATGK